MGRTSAQIGRLVRFIDMQFAIFTPANYRCWQDMIDLDVNPTGWGYDRLVHSVCNARMAILDSVGPAHHLRFWPSYDYAKGKDEMNATITKYEGLGFEAVLDEEFVGYLEL